MKEKVTYIILGVFIGFFVAYFLHGFASNNSDSKNNYAVVSYMVVNSSLDYTQFIVDYKENKIPNNYAADLLSRNTDVLNDVISSIRSTANILT
ncbi:hypothetical protein [Cytobacillus gottheilii]|uniref:hypothetical protein n=1 Tax=Cytobacillus gottheilii TaxID=859144 RepID=UPI0024947D73|nr:hypothetical protein [Cytobacillus gottheilii]